VRSIRTKPPRPNTEPSTDGGIAGRTLRELEAVVGQLTDTSGRYTENMELGRGAMGVVKLVLDADLQREVALKTLTPEQAELAGARARLLREARLAGGLEHPNIVPVYELGLLEDSQPFFTMRRLQGHTLSDILKRRRSSNEPAPEGYGRIRLLTIFIQVCMAVEFAHSRGIVHRDVKPDNIMLGDFGEVQLLDWGIARSTSETDDLDDEGLSLTGTPGYMAPEQILGGKTPCSTVSDVYSLGAVLYEILTLRRPFEHSDPEEVMVMSCSKEPLPPSTAAPERRIPTELDEICLAALRRDPNARTPSARAIARQLEHFMEGVRETERLVKEAAEKVLEGQSLTARYEALRQELSYTRKQSREIRGQIRPWSDVENKRPMWELQDRVHRLRNEVADAFTEASKSFAGALDRIPEHKQAREGLAHLWWSRFVDDERNEDSISARQSRSMVEFYDEGDFADRLRGDGRLTLLTDPADAEVWLYTYEEIDRRLQPTSERLLGYTPLRGVPIPMGSHLLILRDENLPEVRYPVSIRRLQHHEGYVRFYAESEIGESFVYIPGGPFLARGGTTEYGDTENTREVILPDYAISRFPITFREYLEFINYLDKENEEEALARMPRTALEGVFCERNDSGLWRPIRDIVFEGKIREIYPDPDAVLDLPAVGLSWGDAQAWCEWASEQRGIELRLPTENEWEKAARGVDGRRFPWGNAYDPTFANWSGSRPMFSQLEPIGTYPFDTSVYQVNDMCGGASNWCSNWFKKEQNTRPHRGNNWSTASARSMAERVGSFPKMCSGTTGFRVARSLKR
tara:strand:- start:9647 stop:12052 length:2406 start_codon:yes stop_codon:yes gene_type:complete